jgi:hypothetical protein
VLQVLHAGRTKGPKAAEPRSAQLMAQWRAAKTFYTTPFGSNDDWSVATHQHQHEQESNNKRSMHGKHLRI